jgi:long-chain alkane monooxygenase
MDMARALERGCFDGLFFADIPAAYEVYKGNTDEAVRYGAAWLAHDPLAVAGPWPA